MLLICGGSFLLRKPAQPVEDHRFKHTAFSHGLGLMPIEGWVTSSAQLRETPESHSVPLNERRTHHSWNPSPNTTRRMLTKVKEATTKAKGSDVTVE